MKIKRIVRQLLRCPEEFPVQTALGVVFFLMTVYVTYSIPDDGQTSGALHNAFSGVLPLFVPFYVLTFFLRQVDRRAEALSMLLFVPCLFVNMERFLWTLPFFLTYVLAAVLLVVGTRRLDNRPFATHALHVFSQIVLALALSMVLFLAVMAIMASVDYIFGFGMHEQRYASVAEFVWMVVAPLVCCSFVSEDEYGDRDVVPVLRMAIDFILSPAVIIYTVILYIYFIKIAVTWDLPKGGVAMMVTGFIAVALVGHLLQYALQKRHFDLFYRHFTFIAIPPLVLYWIGTIYRIRLYSFTESRWYLLVAGVLMTLFVLMLLWQKTRRYQLMTIIFATALVLFTYIPGLSAKHIGLRCQQARLERYADLLQLRDAQTGKFREGITAQSLPTDSLALSQYREVCDIVSYLKEQMGSKQFEDVYGSWTMYRWEVGMNRTEVVPVAEPGKTRSLEASASVDIGEYTAMQPYNRYTIRVEDDRVHLYEKESNRLVMDYALADSLVQHPDWADTPERLLVHSNDSLLLVLSAIYYDPEEPWHSNVTLESVFKKR